MCRCALGVQAPPHSSGLCALKGSVKEVIHILVSAKNNDTPCTAIVLSVQKVTTNLTVI